MKGFFSPIVLSIAAVFLAVVAFLYYETPLFSSHPTGVACTQEAKECPDGSYVGRTGPNCAFALCPVSTSTNQGTGVLQGTMTIGPICPVEQVGHPCTPTPAMYAAHPIFVYSADTKMLVKKLTPDATGNFSTTLSSGTYTIDVEHQSIGAIKGVPTTITIVRGKLSTISISIDTGIR